MVLDNSEYDAAYFGDIDESGGIKKMYGYTGGRPGISGHALQAQKYRQNEGSIETYNPTLKGLIDKIEQT